MQHDNAEVSPESRKNLTYRDAGVDVDKGNQFADRIKHMVKATHQNRAGVMSDIGGFAGLFDMKQAGFNDPILVSATDGVGTKLRLAIDCQHHHQVGIDLVAMCVNDLLVQKATPLFFLDYFACGALDLTVAEQVIGGIVEGCKQANCALIGGETAEMPGMYQQTDYDLAGFAVGAVERQDVTDNVPIDDDCVAIALPSSGLHSNGFSLVRKILQQAGSRLDDAPPFADENFTDKNFGQLLLTPTKIYVKPIHALLQQKLLLTSCHITGGGFYENLPRILPDNIALVIDGSKLRTPPIFNWLAQSGNMTHDELYRTFNMGVGMVLLVKTQDAEQALNLLTDEGAYIMGETRMRDDRTAPQIIINNLKA